MQRRALVEMPVREVLGRRAQEDPRALPLGAVVDHPHLAQAVGLKVAVGRARRGTRRRAARELAGQYPRYGYRKIRIFLARRGHPMSAERTYRLWHQAGLQVPRRRPRRRVVSRRPRPLAPTAMNHVWAYDFVFDTCADGRSLKCLTVVDEFTRECLAIDVAGSIRSGRVIDVLGQLVSLHGAPRYLRSDNGSEFIATVLLRWLQTVEIDTAFIDPGKPWQNGTDESFNGKFRNECLSLEWFWNRMEAKIGIERWRRHYNEERPHMSLGDLTPAEFKK